MSVLFTHVILCLAHQYHDSSQSLVGVWTSLGGWEEALAAAVSAGAAVLPQLAVVVAVASKLAQVAVI